MKHSFAIIFAMLSIVLLSGCQPTRTGSQMSTVNTPRKLTGNEWDQFANWMKNSMIQTGVLERYRGPQGQPVVIAMADWDNNTDQRSFDRDKTVMENAIRKTLVNSGTAVINRDLGGTGARPESLTQNISDLRESTEYDQATVPQAGRAPAPRLGLYMQINRIPLSQGRVTQYDYAIKCELIDLQNKYSVWEDQFLMSKQAVRG